MVGDLEANSANTLQQLPVRYPQLLRELVDTNSWSGDRLRVGAARRFRPSLKSASNHGVQLISWEKEGQGLGQMERPRELRGRPARTTDDRRSMADDRERRARTSRTRTPRGHTFPLDESTLRDPPPSRAGRRPRHRRRATPSVAARPLRLSGGTRCMCVRKLPRFMRSPTGAPPPRREPPPTHWPQPPRSPPLPPRAPRLPRCGDASRSRRPSPRSRQYRARSPR